MVQFADAAKNAVVVERSLHDGFMKQFGISADTFNATPLTPASHHYTSYLIATAWSAPYPWPWPRCCPASGSTPRSAATSTPAPPAQPYSAWIDTYAGEFHTLVREVIASVDRAAELASAETVKAMHEAYTHAARLEWMFWDSAYRQGTWRLSAIAPACAPRWARYRSLSPRRSHDRPGLNPTRATSRIYAISASSY